MIKEKRQNKFGGKMKSREIDKKEKNDRTTKVARKMEGEKQTDRQRHKKNKIVTVGGEVKMKEKEI